MSGDGGFVVVVGAEGTVGVIEVGVVIGCVAYGVRSSRGETTGGWALYIVRGGS
jgi:hypothetical protein